MTISSSSRSRVSWNAAAGCCALLTIASCSKDDTVVARSAVLVATPAEAAPITALAYWPGTAATKTNLYPAPTPVATITRANDIPRLTITAATAGARPLASARNQAVEIQVLATGAQPGIFGHQAPPGSAFMVVDTKWRNVHARQRMDKGSSEGKADRTMGVGSFAAGGKSGAADSVDVDVAYQVPRLVDHVYLVADGIATAIQPVTEEIPGGPKIGIPFTIVKFGDTRDARFAFVAPADAKDVALQFFDYKFGHVLVPIRGDAKRAAGDGRPPGKVLDKAQTEKLDVAAHSLSYRPDFAGTVAPAGWRYAVVQLGGRSRSVRNKVGDIVQIDPAKFIWLEGDNGYVYPSVGGSTGTTGLLRFTPEIYQLQEVAFLVPSQVDRYRLGLRAENEVARLAITADKPRDIPSAKGSHKDGHTMEVQYLGSHQEGDHMIVDLAIRPLDTKGQGIDIAADQQFMLETSHGPIRADMSATMARINRPPRPFVVPPGTPVRFELSFPGDASATGLKVRGFESEGSIKF